MKIIDFDAMTLQKMRLAFPNCYSLGMYFEGDYLRNVAELKRLTLPPVTFVKEISTGTLNSIVLDYGYRQAARKLSVSSNFLRDQVKNRSLSLNTLGYLDSDVEELAKKIPYKRLFNKLTGRNLMKVAKGLNLDTSSFMQDTKGKMAEDFYESIRGDAIIRNLNKEDKKSPYDFDDSEYGRVNVKSSRLFEAKSGFVSWKFSTKGDQDSLAAVGWDEKFEEPLFIAMLEATTARLTKSTSLNYNTLKKLMKHDFSPILYLQVDLKCKLEKW